MTPPADLRSISDVAPLIAEGEVSPVDLVRGCLARIEARRELNAFISVMAESALAEAERAAVEIAHGRYRGPLHGIPVGVKDIYLTEGKVTEGNSDLYRGFVPRFDATSVRRLKEAGAILVGKTGTSELATANTWPANNPWDLARQAGGSSTGSATGVAASELMIGMGTCTGGSTSSSRAWSASSWSSCGSAFSARPFTMEAVSRAALSLTSTHATFAPSFAKRRAVCRPIPLPAPVMSATLSLSFICVRSISCVPSR